MRIYKSRWKLKLVKKTVAAADEVHLNIYEAYKQSHESLLNMISELEYNLSTVKDEVESSQSAFYFMLDNK